MVTNDGVPLETRALADKAWKHPDVTLTFQQLLASLAITPGLRDNLKGLVELAYVHGVGDGMQEASERFREVIAEAKAEAQGQGEGNGNNGDTKTNP